MSFETTLATVRELSENATLRPAPNVLRCIPLRIFVLKPVPLWKRKFDEMLARAETPEPST